MMLYVNHFLQWIRSLVFWLLSLFQQRAEFNINGYRVREINTIGQGGYGFIYRVQDLTHSHKQYALKKMICQTKEGRYNFQNEVKLLELIGKHQNIVDIYGVHRIQRNDSLEGYILMELGDKTLYNYLVQTENKRLNEKEVLQLLLPICKGLQQLHKKHIAHRDFKVQNILMVKGVPKLIDFGSGSTERVDLAKVSKSQLYNYEEIFDKYSTLMYRPPEMIDLYLKYEVSEKVDIWMLGCVVFVMNYYIHPFQESGKLAIVNAQYRFPDDQRVGEKMKDFIRILLTPNPNLRPTIEIVINIIESWDKLSSIPLNRMVRGMKENERHLKQGNYDQLKFEYNDAAAAAEDQFSEFS